MSELSESNIVNMRVKYGEKNEEKPLDEMITTCDICGKTIIGIENFVNAGDKVVCSEDCKQTAIGQFRHWENTPSHNWERK